MFGKRAGRWLVGLLAGSTMLTMAFTAGYGSALWQNAYRQSVPDFSDPTHSSLFLEVWDKIQNDYIEQPVSDETLFYGAISGLAAAVEDPYTQYFDPAEAKLFMDSITGSFEGIGAEIGEKEGQIVVIAPLPGTPAEAAGLQTNDAIIKIDGGDTTGLTVDEAVLQIRGPAGSSVELTIYRSGEEDVRVFNITREQIELPTADYHTQDVAGQTIGILTIATVDETTAADVREVLNQVLLDPPAGLILDLRGNPGGVLDGAIDIASYFIDSGVIVSEEYNTGKVQSYEVSQTAVLPSSPPLVVLVNGGSASAAEIIAGALQDTKRARVIGTQTFGKGSVQDYQQLSDGSSLKMTVAHWLTPNGTTIQDTGITPDQVVEGSDAQLQAALEYLTQ